MLAAATVLTAVVGLAAPEPAAGYAAAAGILFVDVDNCPGPGDGTAGDPFCSIQAAIDAAVNGDEIVVAPGTYSERIDFLGKAISVRTEGPGILATIIDAGGTGSAVTCRNGEGPDSVLQGFVVTGGANYAGGGMYNDGSSPTAIDCVFDGNTADLAGGGMFNLDAAPTVIGCMFTANIAQVGAGMFNEDSTVAVTDGMFSGNSAGQFGGGMWSIGGSLAVADCTFTGNSALFWGGGMGSSNVAEPVFDQCVFTGNDALFGGGVSLNGPGEAFVNGCAFTGNSAVGASGGGLFSFGGSSPAVTGSTFVENTAAGEGGGMAVVDGTADVSTCDFIANSAQFRGGGMSGQNMLLDCRFLGNEASSGGAVFNGGDMVNCMFSGNVAGEQGGALYYDGEHDSQLSGCTLGGNQAAAGGGAYFTFTGGSSILQNCVLWGNVPDSLAGPAIPLVASSDVEGGADGFGNIDVDPLLVDPAGADGVPGTEDDDLRLGAGSPCIDAGFNLAVPAGITTDLDGHPRLLDVPEAQDCPQSPGFCSDPPVVDMGSYESLGDGCLALTSLDVICEPPGFTVNIEGFSGCTGETMTATFGGSGGAPGEQLCFSLVVGDGGFCCTTEICVVVPDCPPPARFMQRDPWN